MAAVLLAVSAWPAAAQARKPFEFTVGGGATFPLSDSADRFDTGWNFTAGATWNASDTFGLRLDYLYSDHDVKGEIFDTQLDATHVMQYASGSFVLQTPASDGPSFYVLGGPGLYFRSSEITRFAGTGVASYCDPWLFYCYTEVVPIEAVIGKRDATDWGVQGGVGMSFRVTGSARLFLEARYHYVWGDELGGRRANGQYIPISVGVRF
jgi:opacity protein-like surface antigen